jgi:hypothetical protein
MKIPISLLLILFLSSCSSELKKEQKFDIRGSWFTIDATESSDLSRYTEVYVLDSTIWYQLGFLGPTRYQSYYLKNDTIFKCFGIQPCDFIPMYRLKEYRNDTLWLVINSKYIQEDSNSYWVRLPKDEKGPYEVPKTKENSDSLRTKFEYDYDRRKWKWYLRHDLKKYDSMVEVGTWKWSMEEEREWREKNK